MSSTLYKLTFDEEIRPEHYNRFFHPNICHICKKKKRFLKTCEECHMISYCNKKHREMHEQQHMQICSAIQHFLRKDAAWNSRRFSLDEWIQSRNEFLRSIKSELRDLEPYEEQMITLAKSCLICHQQENLRTCKKCSSANYCTDHEDDFMDLHHSRCKKLKACFTFDILNFNNEITFCKFYEFNDMNIASSVDMDSFIKQCGSRGIDKQYIWTNGDYFYSDYISGPLTLFHGLANLNLLDMLFVQTPICVIHIIAANYIDREYVSAWEILLHLLRIIKDLKIIFIGTGLNNESENIDICSICTNSYKQKLSYQSYRMSYNDYVDSMDFKQPSVIICFQADFSNSESWLSKSFSKLRVLISPLLLTAKSKHISDQNINKVAEVIGSYFKPVYHNENKFSSRRSYRDFEDDVYYRNKYLAIF